MSEKNRQSSAEPLKLRKMLRQYEGKWKNDKKHGRGVITWTDGSKYDGEWIEDKRCGVGIYHYPNGDWFCGDRQEWDENGEFDGVGTMHFANGIIYFGEFVKGIPNGWGNYLFMNGFKFTGEVQDGKPKPKWELGQLIYPNGDKYVGEMVDGEPHGIGKFVFKRTGDKYSGAVLNGFPSGKGEYTFAKDNEKFNGNFSFKWAFQFENGLLPSENKLKQIEECLSQTTRKNALFAKRKPSEALQNENDNKRRKVK